MDILEPILTTRNRTANRAKSRNGPTTIDGDTLTVVTPAPQQRTPLRSLEHVRRELARTYRAMKSGAIAHEDGTKRAFVLTQLSRVIEASDLERRLDRLEQQQARLISGSLTQPAEG